MKKLTLLFFAATIVLSSFSQARVPNKIKKAFEAQYAGAEETSWSKKGEKSKEIEYRVEYVVDGNERATEYDYKGNWIITVIFIELDELPEAVTTAIDEEFMNATLMKAARLEEPNLSSYGVALHYMDSRMEIQFREDGRVLRRRLKSEGFDL